MQSCRDDKELKVNRAVSVLADGIMERLVLGDPNVFYWRHGVRISLYISAPYAPR